MSASICESEAKRSTILRQWQTEKSFGVNTPLPRFLRGALSLARGAHPPSIQSFRRSWLFVLSISSCGSDRLLCCFPEPMNARIGLKSSMKRRAREVPKVETGYSICQLPHPPLADRNLTQVFLPRPLVTSADPNESSLPGF